MEFYSKAEKFKSCLNLLTHSLTEGIMMVVNNMATYCKGLASPHLGTRSSTKITLLSLSLSLDSLDSLESPPLSIYSESFIISLKIKIST